MARHSEGTGGSEAETSADAAGDADTGRADEAAGGAAESGPAGRPCPFCGASMVHRHCKYVCPEHGVVYDCSDTFY